MSEERVTLPAFYGVKAGMTRIFDDAGNHIPVTVVKLINNYIVQAKTTETDGYSAYKIGYYEKRENLLTRPVKGELKKANVDANVTRFYELRTEEANAENVGKTVSIEEFAADSYVDVTAKSKGKGFAGVMKRYGFSGGPGSHGSHFHRRVGSIGNRATPGRVFAQKKMPGHMGDKSKTIQNLKIVEVNQEEGYMLIKGSLPGAKNSHIKISRALKK